MTFDWHELNHDGFLSWMVVHLVAVDRNAGNGEDIFEQLSERTKRFTEVDMKISINGIDIPVDTFVDRIQGNMKYYARRASEEIAGDITSEIDDKVRDMLEVIEQATSAIQSKVDKFFQD
jgi:Mg2+ and Co2+ transporter CorA